jgi:hypothetical protein
LVNVRSTLKSRLATAGTDSSLSAISGLMHCNIIEKRLIVIAFMDFLYGRSSIHIEFLYGKSYLRRQSPS